MDLHGLSSNSLILTRKQAVRGRKGNSLLVHAHHHTLAHSLFFLSDSFFLSKFHVFSLIFYPFFTCFSVVLSLVFSFPLLLFSSLLFLLCIAKTLFIMSVMMGFYCLPLNCFCPGIGVLPKPPTGLLTAQSSPLTYAGRATFHSQTK